MSEFALFITEKYLKENTPLDDNIDSKLLATAMREGQDIYIRDIIGSGVYDELCDQVNADTVTADNSILIKQYIQPCLKYYVLYESAHTLSFQLVNKGVITRNSEFSQQADINAVSELMNKWKDRAQYYGERLQRFLCANTTLYPLYANPGSSVETIAPHKQTLFGGFYLGPDSPDTFRYNEPEK